VRVPHLSPTTLTTDEQRVILRATAGSLRDHTIISLALGTGLRLAEIVGLNVGDVYGPGGGRSLRRLLRNSPRPAAEGRGYSARSTPSYCSSPSARDCSPCRSRTPRTN
jgi:integrase